MPDNNQIERIEQYHLGNMSDAEAVQFEKELEADPALRAESDFQSNIIHGIREHRKMALKSRLDAIDISPGWMEFVQQSALVKSFGGLAIATIIGSGVYFFAEKKTSDKAVEDVAFVSETSFTGPIQAEPLSELVLPEIEREEALPETKPGIAITSPAQEPSTDLKEEEVVELSKEENSKPTENFTPKFTAPDANEIADDTEPASAALDKVPVETERTVNEEPIEVETKNSRSSKIKYKYYDGKLFLNGDFRDEPYEILEINSSKGRRIYLLHQRKYFEIKITDRLTELPEVTDVKLIQELRLIKENK